MTVADVAVRAAGGILVRGRGPALEVAVVHRPRYHDWSLPKGKIDPGEDPAACALREVEEETGIRARIVAAAGTVRYPVGVGIKQVDYFLMRPRRSFGFAPNEEVDELRWLGVGEAAETLSYSFDQQLVAAVAPPDDSALHLVRHADAGDRRRWQGPDEERPLSARGTEQAARLASALAPLRPQRIMSSPYRRCAETVAPLAAALGTEIELRPELAEGAEGDALAALIDEVVGLDAVLCSHGDVVPALLERVRWMGAELLSPPACAKGSTWVVSHDGAVFTDAEYFPPPT